MRYMVLIMIAFVYGVNASIRGGDDRGRLVYQLQDVVAKMEDDPVDDVTLLRRGAQIIKRRYLVVSYSWGSTLICCYFKISAKIYKLYKPCRGDICQHICKIAIILT